MPKCCAKHPYSDHIKKAWINTYMELTKQGEKSKPIEDRAYFVLPKRYVGLELVCGFTYFTHTYNYNTYIRILNQIKGYRAFL